MMKWLFLWQFFKIPSCFALFLFVFPTLKMVNLPSIIADQKLKRND